MKLNTKLSIEHQVVVVLQPVVGRHTAARRIPHDGHSIGALEVCLHQLIVAAVAEHHAAKFQALDAQQIDGLLAFVGEAEILGIPSERLNVSAFSSSRIIQSHLNSRRSSFGQLVAIASMS